MPVTLDDVAARAGVSRGTVSLVLNDRKGARIGDETRMRIRSVADEMGYRPNLFARSLGSHRTNTIGLMISGLQNPFFVDLMESAEYHAEEAGYQVLLDSAPSSGGTYRGHAKLRSWPVDGVLMFAHRDQTLALFLGEQASRMPVVYLGQQRLDDTDGIAFDLYDGSRQATEHLVARGCKRIAYASPYAVEVETIREPRYKAYTDICAGAGLPSEFFQVARLQETREAGLQAGFEIAAMAADRRPDALLCHNDIVAIGIYCGIRRAGLRVPEDVAIVGFDGIEEGRFLPDCLTTVVTPVDPFCKAAVETLFKRLNGDTESPALQSIIPTHLFVGDTA